MLGNTFLLHAAQFEFRIRKHCLWRRKMIYNKYHDIRWRKMIIDLKIKKKIKQIKKLTHFQQFLSMLFCSILFHFFFCIFRRIHSSLPWSFHSHSSPAAAPHPIELLADHNVVDEHNTATKWNLLHWALNMDDCKTMKDQFATVPDHILPTILTVLFIQKASISKPYFSAQNSLHTFLFSVFVFSVSSLQHYTIALRRKTNLFACCQLRIALPRFAIPNTQLA